MQQGVEGKCRQFLVQLKSAWDIWGQFKAPLEIFWVKKGNALDHPMTQFLVHRIMKIGGIVITEALKIAEIIKGAIERDFSGILPPLERF